MPAEKVLHRSITRARIDGVSRGNCGAHAPSSCKVAAASLYLGFDSMPAPISASQAHLAPTAIATPWTSKRRQESYPATHRISLRIGCAALSNMWTGLVEPLGRTRKRKITRDPPLQHNNYSTTTSHLDFIKSANDASYSVFILS